MENKKELTPEQIAAAEKAEQKKADERKAVAKKLAETHKVDTLYENSKGEFFTQKSLAIASEAGDKEKVTTHKFD